MRTLAAVPTLISLTCIALSACAPSPAPTEDVGSPDTMPRDHDTFIALAGQHEKVRRTVTQRDDGIETLTESDDPAVTALITEHAMAMSSRLQSGDGFREWDPLFKEIWENSGKITTVVTPTDKGVRVVQTSTDTYGVKLIKAHAQSVNNFVAHGMAVMGDRHEAPAK